MDTLITILTAGLRLIGLAEWFDGWLKQREAAQKAQNIANIPTTDKEWTDAAKNGDL